MKLTKAGVEKLPHPEQGQIFYRDSELKGFALRVTCGSKTYIAESKVNGRSCRVTIGKHGKLTAEQARSTARQLLADMTRGINPNLQRAETRARTVTLHEIFQIFLQTRQLKDSTRYDYQRCLEVAFADWHQRQLSNISRLSIAERYEQLCQGHGVAYANLSMRLLRSLFNFAIVTYQDSQGKSVLPINPTAILSERRQWREVERRMTVIHRYQLPVWWQAVHGLKNATVRDYLLLLLLTGLRKNEAATLRWHHVNLADRILTISDTKNSQPHLLPLSDFLHDLLQQRQITSESNWVFPGRNKAGSLVEPRRQIARVVEQSGVVFSCHDLRRTFATIAESLDISAYAVKRLLNHKQARQDVTAGYIISDVERLRDPVQRITQYVLQTVLPATSGTDEVSGLEQC